MPSKPQSLAVKKLKAQKTAKTFIKAAGNISLMAKQEKITYQAAKERLQNPLVQEEILREFEAAGVTRPKFCKVIAEGMDANDIEFVFKGKGNNRETIKLSSPDHPTRLKAADLYAKATRIIAPPSEKPVTGQVLIVNLPGGLDSIL